MKDKITVEDRKRIKKRLKTLLNPFKLPEEVKFGGKKWNDFVEVVELCEKYDINLRFCPS